MQPFSLSLLIASLCMSFADSAGAESELMPFPHADLLPKQETQAADFIKKYPEYDGRGVVVAIFDSGVDPGAKGLTTTTDGKPKIIDIIDATGSGDVVMSAWIKPQEGIITGASDRPLKISPEWNNPTGQYRVGIKAGYDIFPSPLVSRLKQERKQAFLKQQRKREKQLVAASERSNSKVPLKERKTRLSLLRSAMKQYDDPGPVYDCVTFHDGEFWRAVVDTDEDGDLADEKVMTNYREEQQYASFGADSQLNFSVNIYDKGQLLSLVTNSSEHGTHVAGIVAANYPNHPERSGVAPGAQIVSVKIGDTKLGAMETGVSLMRGLKHVAKLNCDLINMSYGEPTKTPDRGRLVEEFNKFVTEKQVIFVSSAGNSGPALSTVGAPGGTTSNVIGVGAYVPLKLAKSAYASHSDSPGLPYTWTSRGPTPDGDFGVDLFAPGGAVAPVPQFSLQPSRRMNGTSMASPNACGNIALLLSALKQQGEKYTHASILRSLQATAQVVPSVDKLAQGPGLIQTLDAYQHHIAMDKQLSQLHFSVNVRSRNNARGIYLRDAFELDSPTEANIVVRPLFRDNANNRERLNLEVPVQLTCAADWIESGKHLLITQSGADFDVVIDATKLKPGVHVTQVDGRHADHAGSGALFSVPVVVTVPEPIKEHRFTTQLKSEAGTLKRIFLTPPAGSRFAELKVKRKNQGASDFFYLHAVQLIPGESFESHEVNSRFLLKDQETFKKRIPVLPKRTLELCLAQYWSSWGDSDLELEVNFDGLSTSEDHLELSADGNAVPLHIAAEFDFEEAKLSGSLNRQQQSIRPTNTNLKLLTSERDAHWNGELVWQSISQYEFNLDASDKVKLFHRGLRDLLYESPVDSYRIYVFDSNKRLVSAEDMYPEEISLSKGNYSVHVSWRGTNREQLESWGKRPLILERAVKAIPLKFYPSRPDAAQGSRAISTLDFPLEDQRTVWIAVPGLSSLPTSIAAGDRLTGQLNLIENDPHPITISYVMPTRKVPSKPTEKPPATELAFLLHQMKLLDWKADRERIDSLSQRIEKLESDNRELLVTRLHLADNKDRKERLNEVIQFANKVIKSIPQRKLIRHFGQHHMDEGKENQEIQKLKETLIDALYRKGRALAYQELPDVIEENPIVDLEKHERLFEANFQKLSKWVDTTSKGYFLLHIRRDRRQKNYGQALQLLNKHASQSEPTFLYRKKRRDLYELLEWKDWQSYEQHWMWREFPEEEVTF